MAQLPLPSQLSDRLLSVTLARWKAILDPLIAKPQSSGSILTQVDLKIGINVINHLLGEQLQGWSIVDINGAATIYRSAPFNNKTLTLTSSATVTVDIAVF